MRAEVNQDRKLGGGCSWLVEVEMEVEVEVEEDE